MPLCRCKRVFTEEPKSVPIASKKVEQKKKDPEKLILEKQKWVKWILK